MSLNPHCAGATSHVPGPAASNGANYVVVVVLDHLDARPELQQILIQQGCRVIDTDNGQAAARSARQTQPDLLVVDLDVPLLYGLVAARQIIKHAQLGLLPVVVVTHDDEVDPAPMMEVGATRNEYVTRFSVDEDLRHLLDYLLPVLPPTADAGSENESFLTRSAAIRPPLLP